MNSKVHMEHVVLLDDLYIPFEQHNIALEIMLHTKEQVLGCAHLPSYLTQSVL